MNNDEFLKRLSEVCEWTRPQVGPNGAASVTKRVKSTQPPREYTSEELDAMTDEEVQEVYDAIVAWRERQPNDSIRPVVIKLKVQDVDCTDCGLLCKGGRQEEAKLCLTNHPHWRHRCMNCGMYKNPENGRYELDSKGVHTFLGNYYKSLTRTQPTSRVKKEHKAVISGREKLKDLLSQRRKELDAKQRQRDQDDLYHMVPYDNGDSVVYRRELKTQQNSQSFSQHDK